nr:MAG TPA: hypothetical protein [Caudoviricetes sp.]
MFLYKVTSAWTLSRKLSMRMLWPYIHQYNDILYR